MPELSGRTAVVTGAAGPGLGRACARLFVEAGAQVVLVDLSERRLAETASDLDKIDGPGSVARTVALDVSDADAVESRLAPVLAETGVDVLVNNAAVVQRAELVDLPVADWKRVLDVGLTGAFLLLKACLPAMYAQGSGSVVNVASVDAWSGGEATNASYAATKAGLLGLTRAAATEAGPRGVRVNAVAPGLMVNDAVRRLFTPDQLDDIVARTPVGRTGSPEDVAQAVLFLAGDRSEFVTGDVLTVSGGLYYHA
jgi:3-oxoacyl-[acyl-carrier protein] reductase